MTGLVNGTAYSFQLRAENASGSGASSEASATPKAVPGPVTGVTATAAGPSTATLTWTAPATGGGVDSYAVAGAGTIVVSGTSATVTGLSQGRDYSWTVAAINPSGSSAAVSSNSIRIPHAPGSATGVTARATGASTASLGWTAPSATTTAGAATSYVVAGAGAIVVSGTSATVTGLSQGRDYSWTVKAVNLGGSSAAVSSNSIRIPHAPGSATGVTARATGASTASLVWTAPSATTTAGAATSYVVAGAGAIVVSGTSATVTGLSQNTDYFWTVKAFNVSGTSEGTNSNTIRIPYAPGPATGVTATATGSSTASLSWTAPSITTTTGAATSYGVTGSGGIGVSGTSATVTGLSQNTDYFWTVKAVNVSGTSAGRPSNTIRIPYAPGPATGVTATATGSSTASLSWTAPSVTTTQGAATSYGVTGSGGIGVSGTSATVTGLSQNTDYFWTVEAVNVGGTSEGVNSNTIRIPYPPGPVTGLSASAVGGSSVKLTWTAPAVTATQGTATAYDVTGSGIVRVSRTTATTITITGLSQNTTLSWTVKAVNVGGASSGISISGTLVTLRVAKNPQAGGSVTGTEPGSSDKIINCGSDCTETVFVPSNGTIKVKLTATPASDYRFKSWTGCESSTSQCTVAVGPRQGGDGELCETQAEDCPQAKQRLRDGQRHQLQVGHGQQQDDLRSDAEPWNKRCFDGDGGHGLLVQ